MIWRILKVIYRWRYGVRGGIKPPINWSRTASAWYCYRYMMWRIEESIYNRTGLPDDWWAWMQRRA